MANATGNPPPNRTYWLLQVIADYLRAPAWLVNLASGPALRVLMDTNSSVNSVSSVSTVTSLTQFNGLDAREAVWGLWWTEYNVGVRGKIV